MLCAAHVLWAEENNKSDSETGIQKGCIAKQIYQVNIITQQIYQVNIITQQIYQVNMITQQIYQVNIITQQIYQVNMITILRLHHRNTVSVMLTIMTGARKYVLTHAHVTTLQTFLIFFVFILYNYMWPSGPHTPSAMMSTFNCCVGTNQSDCLCQRDYFLQTITMIRFRRGNSMNVTVRRLTVDGTVIADNRLQHCSPVNHPFVSFGETKFVTLHWGVATIALYIKLENG